MDRGSDERVYCAPNIGLPIASIMRSKYAEYEEYHTSLDDLNNVVSLKGLEGSLYIYQLSIQALEQNCYPLSKVLGEPFMSKYGLRSTLGGTKELGKSAKLISDLISYSDDNNSLLDIAEKCNVPIWELYNALNILIKNDLVKIRYKY